MAVTASVVFVFLITALLVVAGAVDANTVRHHHHHRVVHAKRAHARVARPRRHRRARRKTHRKARHVSAAPTSESAVVSGASACPDTNLMPTAQNLALVDASAMCLVNQQRRDAGIAPLVENASLDRAAQAHTNDMIGRGYFEHVSPSGSGPLQRMLSAGFLTPSDGYDIGENIAWETLGLATPASIVSAWMTTGSPGQHPRRRLSSDGHGRGARRARLSRRRSARRDVHAGLRHRHPLARRPRPIWDRTLDLGVQRSGSLRRSAERMEIAALSDARCQAADSLTSSSASARRRRRSLAPRGRLLAGDGAQVGRRLDERRRALAEHHVGGKVHRAGLHEASVVGHSSPKRSSTVRRSWSRT